MENRSMGRTGDRASILGFGCMRLPLDGPKPNNIDYDLGIKMVRSAIDRGVNYVDTAYAYHSGGTREEPGESEPFLAAALRDGYREKVRVATKLPTWLVKSYSDMHRYLDIQLKRLDVRQIDYYLAHNLNASVWGPLLEHGMLRFFDEAVKDGRIRFPAFSFHDEYPLFETIVKSYDWAMAQVQYNYLDQDYQAGRAGVKLAASRGAAVVVMEPLRGGFLVKYLPEGPRETLRKIRPDWSLAGWALNWLWAQSEVSAVLSGMSDMAQTDDNVAAALAYRDGVFGEAEAKAVEEVIGFFGRRIKVDCTACGYCMPCEDGVDIPKNLNFYNQFHLFDESEPKERCRFFYGIQVAPSEAAARCTSCGKCLEKCPQHISIPDVLKRTAETFTPDQPGQSFTNR
ncbi:MAG: aldo/keto reductase [Deltaproteobacteria bacterium]|jgi:predicted aldo/keto reductase-like oxidoreductase|nr:aldo/keto reductase [Deltaproteobacteria bacterium]